MSPSDLGASTTVAAVPDGRLVELCMLLERAGAGKLRLGPEGQTSIDETRDVDGRWRLSGGVDQRALEASSELIRRVLRTEDEIRSLCGEVLERYEEVTLVYRLSERLGAVLGEAEIARLVLDDAARVLGARTGSIWLKGEDALAAAASVPEDAAGQLVIDPQARSAFEGGRPWLREASDGQESSVAVPLTGGAGDPLGVLFLCGRSENRSYRTGEIKLLMAIASLTSAFIRNNRLAVKARQAEAREREDEIARQIHRGLLPRRDPQIAGLDIAGGHRAADRIGGDYYGYLPMQDGGFGLAMADVSGHGVGAALYMAATKGALQAEARRTLSPADLLHRTNEVLVGDFSDSDVFATALFVNFHPGGRRFEYALGGHNPPLLVRSDGGCELLERGGPALGVLEDMDYEEETRAFDPGDVLIAYTDGVVEARDPNRLFYGLDRLIHRATGARAESSARIKGRILEDLDRHCGETPPSDDVTLVVIRAAEPGEAVERRT